MIKRIFKGFLYTALALVLLLSTVLLIPRTYDVRKFQVRPNTQYWELTTGSKIGYQKLVGDSVGQKPPIIYLHGGPGGLITDKLIEQLAPLTKWNYEIYFYDQIGSGHSQRLKDIKEYSVDRHKRDLEQIVEQVSDDQVILIGQSWGALLAMEYLAEHPQRVERLIFTGPGPILPINPGLSQRPHPDSLDLRSPQFSNQEGNQKAHNWRSKFISYAAVLFGKKMSSDREADRFFTYLNNQLNKSTKCDPADATEASGGGGYYAHLMTVKSFSEVKDKRDKIKNLDVPTLIIKGQCDNQKWGFTEEYLRLLKNAKLEIIEGAGHIIGEAHQEEYLGIINSFLGNASKD